MNVIDMSFKRTSYEVEVKYSILYECVLGIAMITYPKLKGKLEKSESYWEHLRNSLSESLDAELQYCQEHNTWKILLQLLHTQDFDSLPSFLGFLANLSNQQLVYHALPFLEESQQHVREAASKGDKDAFSEMILASRQHIFFPNLIHFISEVDQNELRRHLICLMNGWFLEVIEKDKEETKRILKKDFEEKQRMMNKVSAEEFVQWATGEEYKPETNISKVLLIPHYIYSPWTIHANLEGTKVFYYPVSQTSLSDEPDVALLAQFYKALGDEKRLKIIKLLHEKDRSLKELTDSLGIGKTTVHHHLVILRSAQIIKMKDSTYSLVHHTLSTLKPKLLEFLQEEDNK
ncbi:ArsR family transcriptional regulator [Heyndrickxia oleronia]|uniref:HTH arsR-type domain-containing protein n=1 Tax=Heyndrickxia oleronia TaxID=38875 RepID=A0A8E2IHR5_9BACI|nr:metalloregulator ArsR/SmtB family transcription factor [Heyndrickxia oleronia]NYV68023.1 winged helix-turn-helix transcriptional regulator [Bacillus sp. Gen3]OJH19811.1 hypothetical protein BLX88_05950 [Bacillus obstructivus]MCM3454669.1 ArsR family transcriptional regulator [Heyndrickxia oleronia]MEC1375114.1 metalloregulator ArsR/SmtB family transcription factor [Heyndrickxia oleronia]OOP70141.1 hypothetical protein BWZ43_01445 [Heyndrickxia oleronia]